MSSSAASSSPVPTAGGPRGVDDAERAVLLARTGVRTLIVAAIVSAVGAVLVAILAIVGGAGGVIAADVVLVVVALILVALAGFIGGALRAHRAPGARPARSLAPTRAAGTERMEAVTDDEIEAARAMFGNGDGPVDIDPSWR